MILRDSVRIKIDGLAAGGALQFLKIAAAIAVVVLTAVAVVAIFLEFAKVMIQLLDIFAERSRLVLQIENGKRNVLQQVDNTRKQLAFLGIDVVLHAADKPLQVCGFFGNVHVSYFLSIY